VKESLGSQRACLLGAPGHWAGAGDQQARAQGVVGWIVCPGGLGPKWPLIVVSVDGQYLMAAV
jgi:hypothetical protein